MTVIWAIGIALLVLALLWLLLLLPRQGAPGWEALGRARYAHRGLHSLKAGRPENSMAAFRAAVELGFGAELDVHLMRDGALAVVHDSSLKRVCGREAVIEDLTAPELAGYPLQGTPETIPLLEDVLELFAGRAPLIIELKAERGNAAALTDAVMARLEGWQGTYCIESFHPAVLLRLKGRYPQVLRGQLSQNFLRGSAGAPGADPAADHRLHPAGLHRLQLPGPCLPQPAADAAALWGPGGGLDHPGPGGDGGPGAGGRYAHL